MHSAPKQPIQIQDLFLVRFVMGAGRWPVVSFVQIPANVLVVMGLASIPMTNCVPLVWERATAFCAVGRAR